MNKFKSYEYQKKYLLKYQRENLNYRIYRREKYEPVYRDKERIRVRYHSWKSGKKFNFMSEMEYLLERFGC